MKEKAKLENAVIPVLMDWLKKFRNGLSYEFLPKEESPLRIHDSNKMHSVHVRCDAYMGAHVAIHQTWEIEKPIFYKELTKKRFPKGDVTLIDIGANVGLFTRECLNSCSQKAKVYCYEADPTNYKYLQLNLDYLDEAEKSLNNVAVLDKEGFIDFYLDIDNTGNHSANKYTSTRREKKIIATKTIDIKKECLKWLSTNRPIFFKSDIQGLDELIISEMPTDFWNRVYGGIFEIRRIKGKSYSKEKLSTMLNKYKHLTFNREKRVGVNEIMAYIEGPNDETDVDVCFWN